MTYNWQLPDWPQFRYDPSVVQDYLVQFAEKAGQTRGELDGLSSELQRDAIIDLMVSESIKTSEIEGEYVSRQDVMSSVRRHFGLHAGRVSDRRAPGLADLAISVRETFAEPLSDTLLMTWHGYLFETNAKGWRTHPEPMQVVSGRIDRPTIHFEAPTSDRVPHEMQRFLTWFNQTAPGQPEEMTQGPIRSAIAHLYFETIHPFEDGNGRIGRAIAEKALAQGLNRPVLLSLSHAIQASKIRYYNELEAAQRSLDVTAWVLYFVEIILNAQIHAEFQISFVLETTRLFDSFASVLSDRQKKVIRRMREAGPAGFEAGMSASKYAAIANVSKATATRDLQYLLEVGILYQSGGKGPSTRYDIVIPPKGY